MPKLAQHLPDILFRLLPAHLALPAPKAAHDLLDRGRYVVRRLQEAPQGHPNDVEAGGREGQAEGGAKDDLKLQGVPSGLIGAAPSGSV